MSFFSKLIVFVDCFQLFVDYWWLFAHSFTIILNYFLTVLNYFIPIASDYFNVQIIFVRMLQCGWVSRFSLQTSNHLPWQIGPKCGSVPTSPEPLEEPHQHLCPVWGLSIEIVTSLSSISASSTDLEEFKLHSFYSEVSEQIKSPSQLVGQAVEYKIEDKFESLLVIWQSLWKAIPEQGFENVGPWSLSKN